MIQLSSKNDDSSPCYDVIITQQKLKNFVIFQAISNLTVRQTYLEMLFPLLIYLKYDKTFNKK